MILSKLSILNYKNIAEATLEFSPKVNCLLGNNGMGKTNVLDAIFYLSFCQSSLARTDATTVRYGEEFMLLQGEYVRSGKTEQISCALQRGRKKAVKRKVFSRLFLYPFTFYHYGGGYLITATLPHLNLNNYAEQSQTQDHKGTGPQTLSRPKRTVSRRRT